MFKEAFEKLQLEEIAGILEDINPELKTEPLDPVETEILALSLSFYPGYKLLDISDKSRTPALQVFVLYKPGSVIVLDWTNAPIYALNKTLPIVLNDENVSEYVKFFFGFVRGKHGRFLIVESVDDIAWREDPPPAARKTIGNMISPVHVVNDADIGDIYKLQATIVFKDSLFKSEVVVKPDGSVSLANEELLIEDMPVLDDTLGQ